MRHQIFGRRLSQDTNARKALLKNIASSLFDKGKVTTTLAKAKFAQSFIEKLITTAKKKRLSQTRYLASLLTESAFSKLTAQIAPGFAKRSGGYTRIVKLSQRRGDAAPMASLELLPSEKAKKTITESTENKKKAQGKKASTKSSAPSKPSVFDDNETVKPVRENEKPKHKS